MDREPSTSLSGEELQAYTAGGYFLVKAKKLPDWLRDSEALLPDPFFSASDLCDFLPEGWAYSWVKYKTEKRASLARKFSIPADRVAQIVSWVTNKHQHHEFGWISVFYSPELARQFLQSFQIPHHDLVLFGIGLHPKHLEPFRKDAKPGPKEGPGGVYEMLERAIPLSQGGTVCGFEPLEYERGSFHSWLCCYAHKEASKDFRIRPNRLGFISDFGDACRISEALTKDGLPAEPGTYFPWMITVYTV